MRIGLAVVAGFAAPVGAQSLRRKIDTFYAGGFAAPPQGLMIAELLATAAPAVSAEPGLSRAGGEASGWLPDDVGVGGLLVEPARTLGARQAAVGVRYGDVTWSAVEEHHRFGGLRGPFVPLLTEQRLEIDTFRVRRQRYAFTLAYGLLDTVDLAAVLPVIDTHVDLRGAFSTDEDDAGDLSAHFHDAAVGVGDLTLAAKWHAARVAGVDVAAALAVTMPTGRMVDLSGRGMLTFEPAVLCSRRFGPLGVDLRLGVEANATTLEASRARSGLAITLPLREWIALSAEFDARTGLSAYARQVDVPRGYSGAFTLEGMDDRHYDVPFPRADQADALLAVQARLLGPLQGFVGGRIPLASSGLHAAPTLELGAAARF